MPVCSSQMIREMFNSFPNSPFPWAATKIFLKQNQNSTSSLPCAFKDQLSLAPPPEALPSRLPLWPPKPTAPSRRLDVHTLGTHPCLLTKDTLGRLYTAFLAPLGPHSCARSQGGLVSSSLINFFSPCPNHQWVRTLPHKCVLVVSSHLLLCYPPHSSPPPPSWLPFFLLSNHVIKLRSFPSCNSANRIIGLPSSWPNRRAPSTSVLLLWFLLPIVNHGPKVLNREFQKWTVLHLNCSPFREMWNLVLAPSLLSPASAVGAVLSHCEAVSRHLDYQVTASECLQ